MPPPPRRLLPSPRGGSKNAPHFSGRGARGRIRNAAPPPQASSRCPSIRITLPLWEGQNLRRKFWGGVRGAPNVRSESEGQGATPAALASAPVIASLAKRGAAIHRAQSKSKIVAPAQAGVHGRRGTRRRMRREGAPCPPHPKVSSRRRPDPLVPSARATALGARATRLIQCCGKRPREWAQAPVPAKGGISRGDTEGEARPNATLTPTPSLLASRSDPRQSTGSALQIVIPNGLLRRANA